MKIKNYKWGTGQRKTVQQMFQWGTKYEAPPTHHPYGVKQLRYERNVWRVYRKAIKRDTVGLIRAMGAINFFRGCYIGAEND